MFEIIGMVVVGWVVFVIIKAAVSGGIKGTMLRATHKAVEHGVPVEFARAFVEMPEVLIPIRRKLMSEEPDFGTMDAYQQYAAAIIFAYRSGQRQQAEKKSVTWLRRRWKKTGRRRIP